MRRLVTGAVAVLLVSSACTNGSSPETVPEVSPVTVPVVATTGPAEALTTTTLESGATSSTTPPFDETILRLEPVAEGFEQPVFYTTAGGRGFVVDQPGIIWTVTPDTDSAVFLDIRDRVKFEGEQGLLGLAFHPDYPDRFYVDYTAKDGATVVSEFTIETGTGVADPESERVVIEVSQPAANHNGGMIAFGPTGDLWIGMGDGGGSNDRYGNGQSEDTLLGAMLRIAVGPDVVPYGIVDPHGFAAQEIWAIGLRNPWRFSFDGESIWIADVGQGDIEEVDRESAEDVELNFGWPVYEGSACFSPPCDAVDASGRTFTFPIYEYTHDEGCSITGGYVYRGDSMPQLDGHYFFSDWCSGFIRSIAPDGSAHDWTGETGTVPQVTSFGRDESGEIYVVSGAGTVYHIVEDQG